MPIRTILSVSNLAYATPTATDIYVADVLFQEFEAEGPMPFSCGPESALVYAHEIEFWTKATNGDYGPIGPYVEPAP